MNVLVYSGPGVSQTSLSHTISCLKTLLLPNYTVQTISPQALATQPWTTSCALLVIPGGRDLPFVSSLTHSNSIINTYVQSGGAFLGICAGAYYASRRVEWEIGSSMEVCGDRPLRFFNGVSRGCVYPGFQYESENGARAVSLDVYSNDGEVQRIEALYYNGGGEFVDAEDVSGMKILAKYVDGDGENKIAGVHCKVGHGNAILWSVHPEYSLIQQPASAAIEKTKRQLTSDVIEKLENQRWMLMKDTLIKLGLQITVDGSHSMRPLPQYLTSTPSKPHLTRYVLKDLLDISLQTDSHILQDTHDIFYFHDLSEIGDTDFNEDDPVEAEKDKLNLPKHIIVCADGNLPSQKKTPLFNIQQYYRELDAIKETLSGNVDYHHWVLGEVLLYGEVVTSTQTMLDKNTKLLSSLGAPLLSLASHQLSGRGRGSNTWLSPSGCLQFSISLRLSLSDFPASRLVFIQYLISVAIVEACRHENVLGKLGEKVRLKWPNDIYAATADGIKKIGGILVNTSFTSGKVDIVIGCGLNVLNPPPITSLHHLIPPGVSGFDLSMERTAATIMAIFSPMWSTFIASKGSFDPFMDLYLERWLHSDQIVTLGTTDPPIDVRIVGITDDYGLLRTIPVNSGRWSGQGGSFIDLQPDGNSFDMMAGLIRAKV